MSTAQVTPPMGGGGVGIEKLMDADGVKLSSSSAQINLSAIDFTQLKMVRLIGSFRTSSSDQKPYIKFNTSSSISNPYYIVDYTKTDMTRDSKLSCPASSYGGATYVFCIDIQLIGTSTIQGRITVSSETSCVFLDYGFLVNGVSASTLKTCTLESMSGTSLHCTLYGIK